MQRGDQDPAEPRDKHEVAQLALRGVFWQSFSGGFVAVSGFVVFALLARLLEPREFGLVSVATLAIALIQLVRVDGMEAAAVQKADLTNEHLDALFAVNMAQGIVFAGLTAVMAPVIALLFDAPEVSPLLTALAPAFVLDALTGVPAAILQRRLDFKVLAIRRVVAYSVGAVVGIAAAFSGLGAWSLILKQLAGSVAGVVTLWSILPRAPRLRFSAAHFKELFSFGAYVKGSRIVQFLGQRGDEFVVGTLLGVEVLGFYTTARRILRIVSDVLTRGMARVAMPAFSRLQHDLPEMANAVKSALQLSNVVVLPCYVLLLVLAPEAIVVFVGEQWLPSSGVLQALLPTMIIGTAEFVHGSVVLARGRPGWQLALHAGRTVLFLGCSAAGAQFGPFGVALGYSFARLVAFPVSLWMLMKLLPLRLGSYMSCLLPGSLASLLMAAAAGGTRYLLLQQGSSAWLIVGAGGGVGAAVYLLVLNATNPELFARVVRVSKKALPSGVARRLGLRVE